MSCDITEPIKSCVWLGFETFNIPLEVLTTPPVTGSVKDSLTFAFLEDEFEIFVIKALDSVLNVAVYRNRKNPNETPDDGYALRFNFTLIGFDEEPQTAIMKHDGERSNPPVAFKVTENILAKVNTTHHVFELFVVIHMLEFKSVDINDEKKQKIDGFISFIKGRIGRQARRDLSFILKSPRLNDTFTGRLPETFLSAILYILAAMARNFSGVARYLRVRENRGVPNPNLDVIELLKSIEMDYDDGPIEEVIEQYLIANKIGLDCYKTIESDYMVSIMDKDHNVLDVLEASLMVHDKDLFEKAIMPFLTHFHEITRSGKFQYFTRYKGIITRLIIHSARIWVTNNDVYLPYWPPTTEL